MGLILAAVLAIVIAVFSILFITLEIYVGIIGPLKGAPFVRSKPERIRTMIELASITKDTRVVDLGSGDGSIVIEAARFGAIATGIEMNPFLIPYSRWRARRACVQDRTAFIRSDIMHYSLRDTDTVFVYLLPGVLSRMRAKLILELKPGSRIISNGFRIPDWTPIQEKDSVFLYEIK